MPDPNTWTFTRPIGSTANFANHAAVLLSNGQVLIAGGTGGTLARLYDPLADAWQAIGSLKALHTGDPTMTLLLNGKVLLVGGGVPELYDPSTGTWTQTAAMNVLRTEHTATLLPNGQVLVAGGLVNNEPVRSVEVYDPDANTWTSVGDMLSSRANHTATLMDNGPLVFLGGYQGTLDVNTSELYDSLNGQPLFNQARMQGGIPNMTNHTATPVPNGIVAVGGTDNPHLALFFNGAEWEIRSAASHNHSNHTATLLSNGNVLVVGGGTSGSETSAADLYNPSSDLWTPSSLSTGSVAQLNVPRANHTGTLLPDGRYLVIGGTGSITTSIITQNPDGSQSAQSPKITLAGTTAEYYTPPAN